jgi:hypothetical protein
MHVVIIIELTTIVSSIIVFEPKLVPMFFHMVPFENSKKIFKTKILTYCYHHCWYKGRRE